MVGHVFLYNAAVHFLKDLIARRELGQVYYISSQRLNLGRVRQEENVLSSLAPHDISILLYLLEQEPLEVASSGMPYIQEIVEDVASLTLFFPDDILAFVQGSWLSPNKVWQMTIVGSEKMVLYDDIHESKIQIFDKGITRRNIDKIMGEFETFGQFQLITRAGDIVFPKIHFEEPLVVQCQHFLECITNGTTPRTDGKHALQVTRVLEAAQTSLRRNGARVPL